jgi:hypothetical protein
MDRKDEFGVCGNCVRKACSSHWCYGSLHQNVIYAIPGHHYAVSRYRDESLRVAVAIRKSERKPYGSKPSGEPHQERSRRVS